MARAATGDLMTITQKLIAAVLAATLSLTASDAGAAGKSAAFPRLNPLLKAWLQKDLGAPDAAKERQAPTRAVSAAAAISTAKTEVFVYVTGGKACNLLGCTLLILEFNGQAFTKVGQLTALPPVRVIDGAYGDHPDLVVTGSADRVLVTFPVKLHFANGRYAPMAGKPNAGAGRLMIGPGDASEPVYR